MKTGWKEWALAVLLAWVLPWVMASAMLPAEAPLETTGHGEPLEIRLLRDGELVSMELEEYLVGVLLGELPADFLPEAKKAQAAAARTYALSTVERGVKHPGAVCADSGCCQKWVDPASRPQEAVESARAAVEATLGQVLVYDGKLIDATYFSGSGGRTEAAVAVWGSDVPYLQSVESPGEEDTAHYRKETVFSTGDFLEKLGLSEPLALGAVTFTEGGGVESILICGKRFTGTQVRQILGLPSTAFQITHTGTKVRIQTAGYGHRVGMSQYGAEAMARDGKTWQEILAHYYPGTEVKMLHDAL